MKLKAFWQVLQATVSGWNENKISRLAAAVAYYTAFSLAPILVIAIAVAGVVVEEQAVQSEIVTQIDSLTKTHG